MQRICRNRQKGLCHRKKRDLLNFVLCGHEDGITERATFSDFEVRDDKLILYPE